MTARAKLLRRVLLWTVLPLAIVFSVRNCYRSLPYKARSAFPFMDSPFDEMKFDQKRWIEGAVWADDDLPVPQMERGMMLQDLTENHLRLGTTEKEVLALLGRPDEATDEDLEKREWQYLLGAWSGFRMDGDFLSIEFDAQGRVIQFWAWQS